MLHILDVLLLCYNSTSLFKGIGKDEITKINYVQRRKLKSTDPKSSRRKEERNLRKRGE